LLLEHPFILFLHFVSFPTSIFALLKQSISIACNLFSLPSYAGHNSQPQHETVTTTELAVRFTHSVHLSYPSARE
jgi:hypothetical protein